ncbi:DNA-directed RNA polymerase II subunit GRINL1A [Culicoides brevitarsis]|uniref:DNA-directed RNA polymerase II subunit GRINL1A n=1 Tax=Culicoides brevitarsis TaxID=469753 RepID=UPI00307BBCA2
MHNLSRINRLTNQPGLPSHSEGKSYRKDLKKISKVELLEIYEREEKLLKNQSKLDKLPDKGQKIREYFAKVKAELDNRNEIDKAAEQFSKLNIASIGQKALKNLEWTKDTRLDKPEVTVDSDDEQEDDPLKIIAKSNEAEKIVKVIPPEEPLITEEDLKEIESFKNEEKPAVVEVVGIKNKNRFQKILQKMDDKIVSDDNELNKVAEILEPHAIYLCNIEHDKSKSPRTKFLPSRTTKSDVHNPEREKTRKVQRNWEPTAATPPLLKHGGVKTLTLEESIDVQRQQIEHVKKVQEEQAKERLAQREIRARDRMLVDNLVNDAPFFSDYRDPNEESDSEQEFNSDDEVHDEPEDKGGVIYVVEGSS